ncbi:ornithine cyclodeaminase family protein [Pseudonocardia sp. Ae707_Ps2]|uniref:ornithine cyclodeaminase family protein n=1 Tax=Pseudonocardia sp. Ae707_Ps2 TaxID=2212992 RepID=UPI00307F0DD0
MEAPPEGTVDLGELIDAVRALHVDLTLGDAEQPVPAVVETGPSTVLLPMVATSRRLGLTVVKVLTDAQADGPLQQSTVLLLDATTGTRLAVLAGGPGTRMRTAAASAVATDALARGDSSVLGLVGAGPLAVEHVAAIRRVRPIDHVVVWSRTARRIEEFRHTLRARERADGSPPPPPPPLGVTVSPDVHGVVSEVDVLCTLSPAREPHVHGAWFRPGLHVNAVGAPPRPDHREIDGAALARARVVVDSREVQLRKSGEVLLALDEGAVTLDDVGLELGEVLTGAHGRRRPDDVTLFESVGLAIQDLAYAALATGRPVVPR